MVSLDLGNGGHAAGDDLVDYRVATHLLFGPYGNYREAHGISEYRHLAAALEQGRGGDGSGGELPSGNDDCVRWKDL